MSQDDREWYWKDRKRRERLIWNDKRGDLEFEQRPKPMQLRLPAWLREAFRLSGYLAATLVLAWIVLYLVAPLLAK